MNDLLTTNQVQALLQVDRTTIYRMVESGRLPAIRVGKQWRFSRPDIERWLQTQAVAPAGAPSGASTGATKETSATETVLAPGGLAGPAMNTASTSTANLALRDMLPKECVQLIQDAFADILGVMMVITDMQGNPVTRMSNPCGFYAALTHDPEAIKQCIRSWQDLAANPGISPKFMPSEMGLLCARGLVRVESELKGMVVIGGIAPEVWPPSAEQIDCLADAFGLSPSEVLSNADAVYRLDKVAQDKALRSVQRIADIISHIAGDRNALCGKLQAIGAIASLTTL